MRKSRHVSIRGSGVCNVPEHDCVWYIRRTVKAKVSEEQRLQKRPSVIETGEVIRNHGKELDSYLNW